jgi:hypothetical protein
VHPAISLSAKPVRKNSYIFEQPFAALFASFQRRLCTMDFRPQILARRNHHMASAPSYVEQQALPREKSVIENLLDFSFERMMTPRMLKVLYGVHLLMGLIAAVWFVFSGFQTSTSNGVLALIISFAAMLLWIVYCRIVVELLAVVFRAAMVITNSQNQ